MPPKRSHRRRHTPPRPISNGLPPTPKVHMGACFSKIFNGCPLRVHCTASWIHPETRDQHLLIGAEEGIFNLNMNELHDAAIDQLFPRRTTWLYVIKDVLMSLSGKSCQLYRHDLIALHSKQTHRFSMHMNKIPERLVPRKFALTTKVPDTKGCTQCCVTRNPYNGYKYLCGATPNGIFLMQWYDPLNKFMLLKQCEWPATSILGGGHGCVQNGRTPVFEMIITPELEYPIVCTGVRKAGSGCLKLELINMNSGIDFILCFGIVTDCALFSILFFFPFLQFLPFYLFCVSVLLLLWLFPVVFYVSPYSFLVFYFFSFPFLFFALFLWGHIFEYPHPKKKKQVLVGSTRTIWSMMQWLRWYPDATY